MEEGRQDSPLSSEDLADVRDRQNFWRTKATREVDGFAPMLPAPLADAPRNGAEVKAPRTGPIPPPWSRGERLTGALHSQSDEDEDSACVAPSKSSGEIPAVPVDRAEELAVDALSPENVLTHFPKYSRCVECMRVKAQNSPHRGQKRGR